MSFGGDISLTYIYIYIYIYKYIYIIGNLDQGVWVGKHILTTFMKHVKF